VRHAVAQGMCNNPTLVEFSYATGNEPRKYSSFRDYL